MWEVVYLNENHMILYGMRPKVKSFFMVKHNEKVFHHFKFHNFFMVEYNEKVHHQPQFHTFFMSFEQWYGMIKNLHLSMKIHIIFMCFFDVTYFMAIS